MSFCIVPARGVTIASHRFSGGSSRSTTTDGIAIPAGGGYGATSGSAELHVSCDLSAPDVGEEDERKREHPMERRDALRRHDREEAHVAVLVPGVAVGRRHEPAVGRGDVGARELIRLRGAQ